MTRGPQELLAEATRIHDLQRERVRRALHLLHGLDGWHPTFPEPRRIVDDVIRLLEDIS